MVPSCAVLLRMLFIEDAVDGAGDGCADLPARELQALNKELADLTPVVEALGAVQRAQEEVSLTPTAAYDAAPDPSCTAVKHTVTVFTWDIVVIPIVVAGLRNTLAVSACSNKKLTACISQAAELQSLADDKSDPAMAALAGGEREALLAALPDLQRRLLLRLLPQDEADDRSAVLEVRCIPIVAS